MTQAQTPNPATQRRIVVTAAAPCCRTTVAWPGGDIDVYRPADVPIHTPLPAVVFVTGYPDPGFVQRMGCVQKDMGQYTSWAELVAGAGLAAVTYTNRRPDDVHALLRHLDAQAARLGIDPAQFGIWACSGNGPNALGLLHRPRRYAGLRCAVVCYGYLLDLGVASFVADAARTWGFANPLAAADIADLDADVALAIVRAGRDDMPGLNETIDRFVAAAHRLGHAVDLIDHPDGVHAFDVADSSDATRATIGRVVDFLRAHLAGDNRARSG